MLRAFLVRAHLTFAHDLVARLGAAPSALRERDLARVVRRRYGLALVECELPASLATREAARLMGKTDGRRLAERMLRGPARNVPRRAEESYRIALSYHEHARRSTRRESVRFGVAFLEHAAYAVYLGTAGTSVLTDEERARVNEELVRYGAVGPENGVAQNVREARIRELRAQCDALTPPARAPWPEIRAHLAAVARVGLLEEYADAEAHESVEARCLARWRAGQTAVDTVRAERRRMLAWLAREGGDPTDHRRCQELLYPPDKLAAWMAPDGDPRYVKREGDGVGTTPRSRAAGER